MTSGTGRSPVRRSIRWGLRGLTATGHALVLCGLSVLAGLLLAVLVVVVASVVWAVFLGPALLTVRKLAGAARRLALRSSGVVIAHAYRPASPDRGDGDGDGDAGVQGWLRRMVWLLSDPATWRDLRWLAAAPVLGLLIAGVPAALVAIGLSGLAQPTGLLRIGGGSYPFPPSTGVAGAWTAVALGGAALVIGLWIAPRAVLMHAYATRWLLTPSAHTALRQRVRHLTETRADALDAQAAELRRIERDLHDGAQARLIAVTMTLDTVDRLMDDDPSAARTVLGEARAATATALDELRALARGVHPPILADRGLGDAVRALALDAGRTVTVSICLPGRPPPAVESAAYFAVAEALANAVKHANATAVTVDLRYASNALRMAVTDNGRGGADFAGTGLSGVQRRLATFDGTLAVHSPPGGPTTVMMEVPCGLSSPKTTPSSVMD
jgi:signal transduction histidine kinase